MGPRLKGLVVGAPLWEVTTEDMVWVKGDSAPEADVGHHRELGCSVSIRRQETATLKLTHDMFNPQLTALRGGVH